MNTKLYVLFAQRRCSYPGEYAPEALEVMDEWGYDENGAWLTTQMEKYKKEDSMLENLAIVALEIDYDKVSAILNPQLGSISATVLGAVKDE